MFRYDKLSRHDGDGDDDKPFSPRSGGGGGGGRSAFRVILKHLNSVLILGLMVGLVVQAVHLHTSDHKFKNDLSVLRQSLQEDLALQKLSENTSNAHVLVEVA
jgi:hypothetical protein